MHSSVPDEFKPVIFAAGRAECPIGVGNLFWGAGALQILNFAPFEDDSGTLKWR